MCFGRVRRPLDLLRSLATKLSMVRVVGNSFVAPDLVEDLLARDHLPGVLDEVAEQVEFARRELDARLAAARLVQLEVDLDVADLDRVRPPASAGRCGAAPRARARAAR
jgi:hypothetical protein